MKCIGLVLITFFSVTSIFAQRSFGNNRKNSTDKGTIYVYWGYNRTLYTKSNLTIAGPGYNLTLNGGKAVDRPEPFSVNTYLNPSNLKLPQFNFRAGYYYKNGWALSLGYDHFKYYWRDNNTVGLSGEIDPGIDLETNLSGIYTGQPFTTKTNQFHYENSNGMNYIRMELTHSKQLFKSKRKSIFSVVANLGLGAGAIISSNDFNFAGNFSRSTVSLSGYGLSAHTGVRFEFFKHLFLQTNLNSGVIHQLKVRTRSDDASSFAKQVLGYAEYNVVLGGLFYIKPKKKCNDCPTW